KFKLNLMYLNQRYNKTVVEGEGGTIKSNVFIAEGKYHSIVSLPCVEKRNTYIRSRIKKIGFSAC
ncbi:MAG: hypothetical protein HXK19_05340, partial [Alloprevotella tannerae]|nr:hypothetical protein [Alloprevotella tannerae]